MKGYVDGQRGDDTDLEINTDEEIEITATTEKYAKTVAVEFPVNIVDIVTGKTIPAGSQLQLVPNAAHTKWSKKIMVSSDAASEDAKITVKYEAIAYNNRDKAVDNVGFNLISYRLENLHKRYAFEFKIDSRNFNDIADTVEITPKFYSVVGNARANDAKKGYWMESDKKVWELGEGGHAQCGTITLTKNDRKITDKLRAMWSGKYMIPATAFLTNSDVGLEGLCKTGSILMLLWPFKFDYNLKQWGKELTRAVKTPYKIGDVIRYGESSNLDDLQIERVRP